MTLPQVDEVQLAIWRLSDRLKPVTPELICVDDAAGRVLAEPLCADRDSPALDVSAMDGYALRLADAAVDSLPVTGVIPAGSPPMNLPSGAAIKLFTGAPVPPGSELVVRREDTTEHADRVTINVPANVLKLGQNIRRRGENVSAGATVLDAGTVLTPIAMAALASFGGRRVSVQRLVQVAVLNTGDELVHAGESVEEWQIRDSNGPLLAETLKAWPWCELSFRRSVSDQLDQLCEALQASLEKADAVLLTGGVSMGDTDYVPAAVEALGGEIIFHRLPIRPGKPILGAVVAGKLVLGLPGNPVSVAVTSRVFGLPLLRKLAGILPVAEAQLSVKLDDADTKELPLVWYRLVNLDASGSVRLTKSLGSGDLVSMAGSDGFVEVPPGCNGAGPWTFTRW